MVMIRCALPAIVGAGVVTPAPIEPGHLSEPPTHACVDIWVRADVIRPYDGNQHTKKILLKFFIKCVKSAMFVPIVQPDRIEVS